MRFKLGHFRCCVPFAVAAIAGLHVCVAQAQEKAEQETAKLPGTEAQAPSDQTQTRAGAKRSSLKDLEDQLTRALKPFSSKGSLDGVSVPVERVPPPQVVVPARKRGTPKEKNGWVFPDDVNTEANSADPFAPPEVGLDGKPTKKTSGNAYYRSLNRSHPDREPSSSLDGVDAISTYSKSSLGNLAASSSDDPTTPGGVKESAQALQKALNRSDDSSDSSTPQSAKTGFSGFFSVGDSSPTSPSLDQVQAHKALLRQYNQLLSGTPSATVPSATMNSLNPVPLSGAFASPTTLDGSSSLGNPGSFGSSSSLGSSLDSLPTVSSHSQWSTIDTGSGSISPTLVPSATPDFNSQALGQWSSMYTTPKTELPRFTPPTPTFMNFPMRKF